MTKNRLLITIGETLIASEQLIKEQQYEEAAIQRDKKIALIHQLKTLKRSKERKKDRLLKKLGNTYLKQEEYRKNNNDEKHRKAIKKMKELKTQLEKM